MLGDQRRRRRACPSGEAEDLHCAASIKDQDVIFGADTCNWASNDDKEDVKKHESSSCQRWVVRQQTQIQTSTTTTTRRTSTSARMCLLRQCFLFALGAFLVVAMAWGAEQYMVLDAEGNSDRVLDRREDSSGSTPNSWQQTITVSNDIYYGEGDSYVQTTGADESDNTSTLTELNEQRLYKRVIHNDRFKNESEEDEPESGSEDPPYNEREEDEPEYGSEDPPYKGHSHLFEPGELDLHVTSIANNTIFRRQLKYPFIEGYAYQNHTQNKNHIDRDHGPRDNGGGRDNGDGDGGDAEKKESIGHTERHHPHNKRSWKTWPEYFAFDDDVVKHPFCRRPAFYYHHQPNCNKAHELGNLGVDNGGVFVGFGAFREAWSVDLSENSQFLEQEDREIIIKQLRYTNEFIDDFMDDIRKDAMVMDLLSSSPRIVDMYGHCGTTLLVESLAVEMSPIIIPDEGHLDMSELEEEDTGGVRSMNELTNEDKLHWALGMARALSDLHGFHGGILVHSDIQPTQFMLTWGDHRVKLSDFNRAEVLLWDEEEEEYCHFFNGGGMGALRSPEEYRGEQLTHKTDIYSFGNILYGLLTGLYPHYDVDDDYTIRHRLADDEVPFIDDRFRDKSYAENQLVFMIEACWELHPHDRPSIFLIVHWLEIALEEFYKSHSSSDGSGHQQGEEAEDPSRGHKGHYDGSKSFSRGGAVHDEYHHRDGRERAHEHEEVIRDSDDRDEMHHDYYDS